VRRSEYWLHARSDTEREETTVTGWARVIYTLVQSADVIKHKFAKPSVTTATNWHDVSAHRGGVAALSR
jgi:hypothetical protein